MPDETLIKTADAPDAQKSTAELILWLEASFRWGREARKEFELKAVRNLFFWVGDQYVALSNDLSRIYSRRITRPAFCETVRTIDSRIPNFIRQQISNCTDSMSEFEAIPATSDPSDKEAAALATRLIKMREHIDKEDALRESELLWLMGAGENYRRTSYDPKKETPDGIKGDLCTESVSFFRCVKHPPSADAWPPKWIIEFDARPVDDIQREFGVKVEPEAIDDVMRCIEDLAQNVVSGNRGRVDGEKKGNSAIVKRMFYSGSRPGFEKGQMIVWANGKILKRSAFQADMFPISRAVWYPVPGRFYPMSYIDVLADDQMRLNTLVSQLQEGRNRTLRHDIKVIGNMNPVQEVIDTATGQKVIRVHEGDMEFVQYNDLPASAQFEYEQIAGNLNEKGGISDTNRGQSAKGDQTATELQLAREATFANVSYHMRAFDRHICTVNQHKIALAKEYFKAARVLQDVGVAATREVTWFFGAQLGDTIDVIPVPTPRLTPAMKRKAIAEAVDAHLLGPFLDPNGNPDKFIEFYCRTALREKGLAEVDESLAQTYGPYEDLQKEIGQLQKMMSDMKVQGQLMQMQASLQPQMPVGPDGQPMPPNPLLGDSGATGGEDSGNMPQTPMNQGALPNEQAMVA